MSISKKIILSILLIFVLAAASALIIGIPTATAATTLEVPSQSYPTIQSALNAAKDGDNIKVAAGTYNENINYDGYAQAVAAGSSQPKTGITLQGQDGTIINGDVTLLYLNQLKIDGITITGGLTFGNSGAYGYVTESTVSNVEVLQATSIGGSSNTLNGNTFNDVLTLHGGNGKMDIPSTKTTLTSNQITNGLTIEAGSAQNVIRGNVISGGEVGILEEASKQYFVTGENQIVNNTITDTQVGIHLYSSTGDNNAPSHSPDQIIQNTIKNNGVGIEISASTNYPKSNTIYHNNFIDNGVQIKINNSVTNVWDDGAGKGNYWSDYGGSDVNSDGVGDTPYTINAENQDSYPLMTPWSAASSLIVSSPSKGDGQTSGLPANAVVSPTPIVIASESPPLLVAFGLVVVSALALIVLKRRLAAIF
jgi:hypothetical protein